MTSKGSILYCFTAKGTLYDIEEVSEEQYNNIWYLQVVL